MEEKYCVNCKWHQLRGGGGDRDVCTRLVKVQHNLISGEPCFYDYRSCHDERTNGNPHVCGANAQFFEPKPEKPKSRWERLIHHLAQRLGT